MKKILAYLCIILAMLFMVSCNDADASEEPAPIVDYAVYADLAYSEEITNLSSLSIGEREIVLRSSDQLFTSCENKL